jgi:hypothetical protein
VYISRIGGKKRLALQKKHKHNHKKNLKDFTARKYSLVYKGTKSPDTPNSKYKDIQLFEMNPV